MGENKHVRGGESLELRESFMDLWTHLESNSDLELGRVSLSALLIRTFSHRQRLQLWVLGEYDCALFLIYECMYVVMKCM